MHRFLGQIPQDAIRVKVIGVGGAGGNIVNQLKRDHLEGVRLAALNMDIKALQDCTAEERCFIGSKVTRGLGTGGDIELALQAADLDKKILVQLVNGTDLLFIVTGLGGGVGGGIAPIIAQEAAAQGAIVIAFATLPFTIEGKSRVQQAEEDLSRLKRVCDAVIPLPNDLILQYIQNETTVLEAFSKSNTWISRGIRMLSRTLFEKGLMNVDFSALRKLFWKDGGGKTLFSIGRGEGIQYVRQAIESLQHCPLLHLGNQVQRADALIINIIGGNKLKMADIHEILSYATQAFGSDQNNLVGAILDKNFGNCLEVCILGITEREDRHIYHRNIKKSKESILGSRIDNRKIRLKESLGYSDSMALKSEFQDANQTPKVRHDDGFKQSEFASKRVVLQREQEYDSQRQDSASTPVNTAKRGYFDKSETLLLNGRNIDIPTYLRRGIKIKLE